MGGHPRRLLLSAGALSLALAFFVEWPYRNGAFFEDDLFWLIQAGLLRQPDPSFPFDWFGYFRADDDHVYVLWKLEFFAMWRLFGVDVSSWRAVITVTHALTACAAAMILFRYLRHWLAPAIALILWSACSAWGGDSALRWLSCGFYPTGLFWFLCSILCVSNSRGGESFSWMLGAILCGAVGVLTWSSLVLWLPIIPFATVWLENTTWRSVRKQGWFRYWMGAFLVLFAGVIVNRIFSTAAGQRMDISLGALFRVIQIYSNALARLVVAPIPFLGVLLLAAPFLLVYPSPLHRRLSLVFLALTFPTILAIALFRADGSMVDSRYAYLAMFSLVMFLAILLDGSREKFGPLKKQLLFVAILLLLVGYVVLQRRGAVMAEEGMSEHTRASNELLDDLAALARGLSEKSSRRGERAQLISANIPLPPPYPKEAFVPIRPYFSAIFPEGLPGMEVRSAHGVTEVDIANTLSVLASEDGPAARLWREGLRFNLIQTR